MKLKEDFIKLMKTYKSIKTVLKSDSNTLTIAEGYSQIDLVGEEHIQILVDTDTDNNTVINQESLTKLINLKIKDSVEILEDKVILDGKVLTYTTAESPDKKDLSQFKIDFTCKAVDFKKALKGVVSAIGNDIARPILNNILVEGNTLVAVDGYRIFTRKVDVESSTYTLIPQSVVKILEKLLPNKSDDILTISGYDSEKAISWGDFTVVYKEQQGEFLKWEQVMSTDYEFKVEVNRQQLIDELEFAANTQAEVKKAIVKLVLTREALKVGDKALEADVDFRPTKESELLKIAFRVKYLLDSLKSSKDEKVTLRFISALTPVIIDSRDLILPVRLNN